MASSVTSLHPGITAWTNERGVTVLRLHYDANPDKAGLGKEFVHVAEINRDLGPWAFSQYQASPSPTMYLQELEIEFGATLGDKVYYLYPDATLEKSFPIPEDWTRFMALDPHPSVPHCALWGAVDRYGDLWIYRELWPSKAYGKSGKCPQDDNRYTIKEFVEAMSWLESKDNDQNSLLKDREKPITRVIDYAARGFGKDSDNPEALNYQQRFEAAMTHCGMWNPYFKDCDKDRGAGEALVNEWLKPRQVEDLSGRGGWIRKSKVHIFQDRCPELIWELNNNRREQLTPSQAEKKDPTGKALDVRKHMTDCLLYMIADNPIYRPRTRSESNWEPTYEGVGY